MTGHIRPTEFRGPIIRKTTHLFGCWADLGNGIRKLVEFEAEIAWVMETASRVVVALDGSIIKEYEGFTDYYGRYKSWEPAIEQAVDTKKQIPSATVYADTSVIFKPIIVADVDPATRALAGLEGAFAGYHVPHGWFFMDDEVRKLAKARDAGMEIDWFNLVQYIEPINYYGIRIWKDGVDSRDSAKEICEQHLSDFLLLQILTPAEAPNAR